MKIALFGRNFNDTFNTVIQNLISKFSANGIELLIYRPFHQFLTEQKRFSFSFSGYFDHHNNLPKDTDYLISIGGDGTFLEAITVIRDSGIPILGINAGRLGFLANVTSHETDQAIDWLISKKYEIEERSLLEFASDQMVFSDYPNALNECTIQKAGSSLTTFHVTINDEYIISYWADGLIIATPTGSTAYSLSVGGPIVLPQSNDFIITPIAAHNLNVRPLVIPDSARLSITVEGRTDHYLATLDSRSAKCNINNKINISKAQFSIRMIKLPEINFYSTLRNKLMWGSDKRN